MNNTQDVDIDELKQLSQMIAKDTITTTKKKVTIQTPPSSESSETPDTQVEPSDEFLTQVSGSNFDLMGFAINKQTIYLLIALILIGLVIWFITGESLHNKDKPNDEIQK